MPSQYVSAVAALLGWASEKEMPEFVKNAFDHIRKNMADSTLPEETQESIDLRVYGLCADCGHPNRWHGPKCNGQDCPCGYFRSARAKQLDDEYVRKMNDIDHRRSKEDLEHKQNRLKNALAFHEVKVASICVVADIPFREFQGQHIHMLKSQAYALKETLRNLNDEIRKFV